MPDEVWALVDEFPDYAVSTAGEIRNLKTNAILKPRVDTYGYHRVGLRRDGKTFERYVHRIVARAFITGYHEGVQIRHVGRKNNNGVMNLRFRKGARLGTITRKPTPAMTRRVRIVELGTTFDSVSECARYISGDASSIYRVIRGERSSHMGHTFEYIYEEP